MRAIVLAFVALVLVMPAQSLAAGPGRKIDADPNKKYRLTKRHGPWMIMVASMRDITEKERLIDGMSAQEAADRMVLGLRRVGIPAYTYRRAQSLGQVETTSRRSGERVKRTFVSQQDRIVVVAGNYKAPDDQVAKKTLSWIKGTGKEGQRKEAVEWRKQLFGFLTDEEGRPNRANGALYHDPDGPKGARGPLSNAFLIPNPLVDASSLRSRRDPLLLHLNKDMEHSLNLCPGKYSLVIATFRGKLNTHTNDNRLGKSAQLVDSKLGSTLDQAYLDAWRLCQGMRTAKSLGYDRDYDTYVYHDRHYSVVTIGAFDDPKDPRIRMLARQFGSKSRVDPRNGREVQTAELFTVPRRPKRRELPQFMWMLDPKPELIEVPKL